MQARNSIIERALAQLQLRVKGCKNCKTAKISHKLLRQSREISKVRDRKIFKKLQV